MAKLKLKKPKLRRPKSRSEKPKLVQPWDFWMKMLIKKDAQALVSFLMPGAVFQGARDKELQVRTTEADLLFDVIWNGQEIILHIEFQRTADKNMALRLWEYNVVTRYLAGRSVYSVVIYLVEEAGIIEPPYKEEVLGELVHIFYFRNIKLWKIPSMMFKQAGLEGLLPLLPLTQGGKSREVVEEMIAELEVRDRRDLLAFGFSFAALVFTEGDDMLWLQERFDKMHDILEGSWVYQEIVGKGLQQGLQLGLQQGLQQGQQQGQLNELRQMLIRRVQKCFPVLAPLAQEQSRLIEDVDVLRDTIDAIIDARTIEDAERALDVAHQNE